MKKTKAEPPKRSIWTGRISIGLVNVPVKLFTMIRDNSISFRYDYLTLIRVIKEYLPKPYIPRPTGQDWYYLIKNATP